MTALTALMALAALTILAVLPAAQARAAAPTGGIVHTKRTQGESKLEWGKELFAGNCASCHGPLGQGATSSDPIKGTGDISGYGPNLQGVGALAPDFYLRTGRMPLAHPTDEPERSRPLFDESEQRAMTRFVASLGRGPSIPKPKPEGASLSQGLRSFTDHCAGCHQVVGEGGYVTGARVPVLQHASATEIAEAVRIGPYVMPHFSKNAIGKHELNALVAYVLASHHPDDRGGLGIGHIGPVPEGMIAWLVAAVALVAVCIAIGSRLKKP